MGWFSKITKGIGKVANVVGSVAQGVAGVASFIPGGQSIAGAAGAVGGISSSVSNMTQGIQSSLNGSASNVSPSPQFSNPQDYVNYQNAVNPYWRGGYYGSLYDKSGTPRTPQELGLAQAQYAEAAAGNPQTEGKFTKDYLAAAFPELNPWERAGAPGADAGIQLNAQGMQGSSAAGGRGQADAASKLAIAQAAGQTAVQSAALELQDKQINANLKIAQMNQQTQLQQTAMNNKTALEQTAQQTGNALTLQSRDQQFKTPQMQAAIAKMLTENRYIDQNRINSILQMQLNGRITDAQATSYYEAAGASRESAKLLSVQATNAGQALISGSIGASWSPGKLSVQGTPAQVKGAYDYVTDGIKSTFDSSGIPAQSRRVHPSSQQHEQRSDNSFWTDYYNNMSRLTH